MDKILPTAPWRDFVPRYLAAFSSFSSFSLFSVLPSFFFGIRSTVEGFLPPKRTFKYDYYHILYPGGILVADRFGISPPANDMYIPQRLYSIQRNHQPAIKLRLGNFAIYTSCTSCLESVPNQAFQVLAEL